MCPLGEHHLAARFEENDVYFQDGSHANVDVVIFCTGYKLEFPFMQDELRLRADKFFYPDNLYKGVLWIKGGNHKLLYVGMQYNIYHFVKYACQAMWACQNIMGKIELPSKDVMLADIAMWDAKATEAIEDHHFPMEYQ